MQKVSERLSRTIDSMYASAGAVSTCNRTDSAVLNYTLNNVFQRFFKVSIKDNQVEIPMFARTKIQPKVISSNTSLRKDIVIPLICTDGVYKYNRSYRTVEPLLRDLMDYISTTQNMYHCAEIDKGGMYYGGSGILFNKDEIPIFFNVLVGDIENNNIIYKKIRTYIHPSVFCSDNVVEKCVVNKIIPYVLQNGVYINNSISGNHINYATDNSHRYFRAIPEIVVADIEERFFCEPVPPSITYTNDSLNDTLGRNIEDVFEILRI